MKTLKNGCCTPVLPLVYDDSLSYYEVLCKVTNKLNEIISALDGNLTDEIVKYIDERFNDIMLKSMYDSETETLILYLEKEG